MLREAVVEVFGRRRLIAYLVQADLHKKGADTLLGNVWWVLDPLLQMAVYVVLMSVIFQRGGPDYPLFILAAILPWKWFESMHPGLITSVSGAERLVEQIKFPKIVLPVAAVDGRDRQLRVGLIPLFALMLVFYRDRSDGYVVLIPSWRSSSSCSTSRCGRSSPRQRVLSRRGQPCPVTCCACGSTCRRRCARSTS